MGFIPFIDDHETESVEQRPSKSWGEFIRMTGWKQADFARQVEVEERDFAVPATLGGIVHDGTGHRILERVSPVDRPQPGITFARRGRIASGFGATSLA